MKTKLSALLVLIVVIGFAACQKEVDGTLTGRTASDSTRLDKYIELDTTMVSGLDTMSVSLFEYDNRGRLTTQTVFEKDVTLPPTLAFHYGSKTRFFYNGNDSFPSKTIDSSRNSLESVNDTTYYFYLNGGVVKDSSRTRYADPTGFETASIDVRDYTSNGSNTTVTQKIDYTLNPATWPPPCPATTNYVKTYVNGNITSEIGSYSSCSGIGTSESHFIYDNKPNPFYPLRIPYPILDGKSIGAVQKNNIIESGTFSLGDNFRYSYTYRSDGYPLVVRVYEVTDPANAWKGIFVYK